MSSTGILLGEIHYETLVLSAAVVIGSYEDWQHHPCELKSKLLKWGYIGDYIGDYYRGLLSGILAV